MQDSGLSKRLFPIHLKPQDDELLSSWLVRLALAHGLSPVEFDSILNSPRQVRVWNLRDLDLNTITTSTKAPSFIPPLLVALSKKTATPLDRVNKTTLDEYEERLYYKQYKTEHYSWIIQHEFRSHVEQKRFGMQACPQCLAGDEQPYFRRSWRFAFVVVCPSHKCFLIDRCSNCGEPILFHRSASYMLHFPKRAITSCYKCWFDLRDTVEQKSKIQMMPEPEVIDLQKHLLQASRQTYIKTKGVKSTPTEQYFDLLHWILNTIIQPYQVLHEIQTSIFKYYDFNFNVSRFLEYCRLECLDVVNRYKLIWLLSRLLTDYPDRYLQFCSSDNLLRRIWLGRWRQNPLWYLWVLETEQKRQFLNNGEVSDILENHRMIHSKRRNEIAYYEEQERLLFGKSDETIKMEKEFVEIDYSDQYNLKWEPLYRDQYNFTAAQIYLTEFIQIAARLHSEGVRTIHIARILNVSHVNAWKYIKLSRDRTV